MQTWAASPTRIERAAVERRAGARRGMRLRETGVVMMREAVARRRQTQKQHRNFSPTAAFPPARDDVARLLLHPAPRLCGRIDAVLVLRAAVYEAREEELRAQRAHRAQRRAVWMLSHSLECNWCLLHGGARHL